MAYDNLPAADESRGPVGDRDTLIKYYQEMAQFTREMCDCDFSVYSCCDPGYCSIAKEWAKSVWNVALLPTGDSKLPFMGKNGCVVSPHLRPLCTVHICEKFLLDPAKSTQYFILREAIEDLEWGLHGNAIDAAIRVAIAGNGG